MNIKLFSGKIGTFIRTYPGLKLYNLLGVCLLIATIFIIGYSYIAAKEMTNFAVDSATNTATDIAQVMKENALDAAMEQLITQANAKAFQVQATLEQAMGVASTLAEVFSGMSGAGVAVDVGRDSVNSMLRTIIEYNKNFTGVYTLWEPDAFDMLDLAYVGAEGHDNTGRFIPYWYRRDDGKIGLAPSQDYEKQEVFESGVRKGEYYLAPRETKTPHIINPYLRLINVKMTWMTSVVVPIIVDDTFVGIAGIDLRLDFLQELAEEVTSSLFMGKGTVMFISHNGTVAAINGKSEYIGRHIEVFHGNWEKDLKYIRSGATIKKIDNGQVIALTPLKVGQTTTPWSVHLVVPENLIQTEANTIYQKMMDDVEALAKSLSNESSKAIRTQIGVGTVLTLAIVFISMLIRALEKNQGALRESEGRLQSILDNTSAIIYIKDLQGRFMLANRRFENLFHFSKEEIMGKTNYDFMAEEAADMVRANDQKVLEAGIPLQLEEEIPHNDGLHTYISVKFPMYNPLGVPYGVGGISTDITDRKRAEEELRRLRNLLSNIVNSMPSVLVGVDLKGHVIQWNRQAELATGVTAGEAHGRILTDVFPQLAGEMKKVRQALQTHEPQKHEKVTHKNNGETRFSDVAVYPLIANGIEGAVIRIDDVTERVHIEEMMIQTEKMMSVGGLAAGMAHEINNPLAIILQGIQNTLRRVSPELRKNQDVARRLGLELEQIRAYLEQRNILQYLEGMQEAGTRAAKIVTNMLNFSRRSESNKAPTDINQLLEDTIELAGSDYDLKKKYDFRQIEIICKYDPMLPLVPCTATTIEQVFLNLLRNAAQALAEKHAAGYKPQMIIRTQKDKDNAIIEIEDNGPGMNAEIQKRIFEPFYTTKAVGIGTGLGLSVSYFIITTNHKGSISVESEPGEGTKFIIRLPLGGT